MKAETEPNAMALTTAAAEIRQLHAEILAEARMTLAKAFRIGERLAQVKADLPHGRWLPWLEANLPFDQKTAWRYMQCWEHRAKLGTMPNLTDAYRLMAGLGRRERTPAEVKALPDDKYRVIYADPPWRYNDQRQVEGWEGTAAEHHYPTLSVEEICALPVRDIVQDNAVLFLWVTVPLLAEAWPVIAAWGFEYKTHFIWDKVRHAFGNYSSVRHELLLVATRGSCVPDNKQLFDSVQSIERTGRHSEKPEDFRRIIEALYPEGKRLELFARQAAPGWDLYGNEVQA